MKRVNTSFNPSKIDSHSPTPAKSVNTEGGAVALQLKLRTQAKRLGLIPGSAPWRAYVLGTIAAMKKRKQQKAKRHFRPV